MGKDTLKLINESIKKLEVLRDKYGEAFGVMCSEGGRKQALAEAIEKERAITRIVSDVYERLH